jgi:gliding motility-associated-like protein
MGGATGVINLSPHGGNNEEWNLVVRDSLGNTVNTFNVQEGDIEVGNLPVGEYSLEIVSPTTCLTEAIYSVGEPEPLEFDRKEFDHSYCDESNAYLDYTPRGGVAPYKYHINGQEKLDLFEGDLDQGIYDVRIEDANGCYIDDRIQIFDKFPPQAYFEVDYEEINLEDATIHFTDATITNDHSVLVKWRWHFGDGGTSTEPNPIHTYTDIGEYKVILEVYDENNCFSEVTRYINVIDPVMIYPTAFTPNGDGINEFFKPVKSLIRSDKYLLVIYDRWGKEMFRTNDVQQGWAGFDKTGKEASSGTYVWKAEYMDDFMHEKQQEGVFQLMR